MQRPGWGIFLQMILGVMALLLVLEEIKLASLKKESQANSCIGKPWHC
jgi:glucose uptake protein GlcU